MDVEIVIAAWIVSRRRRKCARIQLCPTRLLAVSHHTLSAMELEARLRAWDPPIVARIEHDRLVLDLRTVLPGAGHDADASALSAQRVICAAPCRA